MVERVRGLGRTLSASFTRPSNTTAYTAGDVVGDGALLAFNGSRGAGEPGIVQQAILTSSSLVSPALDAELWLFDTAPAVIADNAAFAITDAEILTLVGVIKFSYLNWVTGTLNQACVANNLGMPFNTKPGTSELYGMLVARNAYVPTSQEVFQVRLQMLD